MMSIPIRTTAASLALLFASLVQAHAGTPQGSSSSSSWRPLFDGHSLERWDHWDLASSWSRMLTKRMRRENSTMQAKLSNARFYCINKTQNYSV